MKTKIDATSKTDIVPARRSLLRNVRGTAEYVGAIVLIVALALGGAFAINKMKDGVNKKGEDTQKKIEAIQ